MIIQATEIFIITSFFGLYCLGSLFNLYLVLIITGLSGISIGLFISAISPTEQGANQMYMMLFIILIIFSGTLMPAESLGSAAFLVNFLPLIHASNLVTDITLRGLPLNMENTISLLLISAYQLRLPQLFLRFPKMYRKEQTIEHHRHKPFHCF